ncbi:MAG: AMP-binding protein [Bacilli bacterium]|nr:AMP-binding protein [Bacilli bacterium]
MNSDYNKIKKIMSSTASILNTSMKMEDIFAAIMSRNDNKKAAIYYDEKGHLKTYKYSKTKRNAYEFASVISKYMLQKPKHRPIVLKLSNGPHWSEAFWAILMSGYKPLLIDARTSKEGTDNLINQSKAIAIVTDDKNEYEIHKFSLNDLLKEEKTLSHALDWENEVIFCSSGTTGDVKLMVFNGENLCHQLNASSNMYESTSDIVTSKPMRMLAMIPFHHIFGFVAVYLWYAFYGACMVYPRSVASNEILTMCQKVKITHVYSVPLFWDSLALGIERKFAMLSDDKKDLMDKMIGFNTKKISMMEAGNASSKVVLSAVQKNLLGNKVRFCISGGGYLNSKTLNLINGVGYHLYNGYGMTELGVISVELSPDVLDRLKGSIGKPFLGIDFKLKKKNKKDATGELFVRSKITHVREIIGGKEQDVNLDEEGYFATGDIAECDSSNRYYIRGRIKDIIINSDGENIFPDELEIFYKKIPNVTNLCVLGVDVPGTTNQKIVIALEVPNHITDEQLEQVKNDVIEIGKTLPKKTVIKDIYLATGKLPMANNMKVKRFMVKKGIETNSKDYVNINAKKETKKFKGFDQKTIESIVVPLRDLFSKILVLPKFKIEDDGHWINDLGGDSMNYVQLILDIQEQFKVTIPETKYGQLTCINDFAMEIARLQKNKK